MRVSTPERHSGCSTMNMSLCRMPSSTTRPTTTGSCGARPVGRGWCGGCCCRARRSRTWCATCARRTRRSGSLVLQLFGTMRLALADVGLRIARHEAGGADVAGAQLAAQLFHQPHSGDLAHRVDAGAVVRDDALVEVVVTIWQPCLPANMRGTKVLMPYTGPQKFTPMPHSQSLQRARARRLLQAHAGVVDEDVHGAVHLLDQVGGALPAILVHDVVHDRADARIAGRKFLQRVGKLLVVQIADHHPGAASCITCAMPSPMPLEPPVM